MELYQDEIENINYIRQGVRIWWLAAIDCWFKGELKRVEYDKDDHDLHQMLVRYQLIQRRGTAGTAHVIAISFAEKCLRIFWSQQIRCRSTFELQDCLEMCLATQKAPGLGTHHA